MANESNLAVHIERLAYGGAGVGRINGKVCFVQGAVPGDELRINVVADKRSYLEAEILEIINPGTERITPPCPVFGQCGGCQWQQLAYGAQLQAKEHIFSAALQRTAHVSGERILPILASENSFGYRSRIQVKINCVHNRLFFGFYRPGTHQVIEFPDDGCMLADSRLNQALVELRVLLAAVPDPYKIPQVDLSVGDSDGVLAIVHYLGNALEKTSAFLREHQEKVPSVGGMFVQSGGKESIRQLFGNTTIQYKVVVQPGKNTTCDLQVTRGGFSQVNFRQNQRMIQEALRLLDPSPSDLILDLFCGNGNFSIPLALCGSQVKGMDDFAGSIADAEANADRAAVTAHFRAADAELAVKNLVTTKQQFTALVLDPPRTGARNVIGMISQLGVKKIVYVSCDPMTLARDLALLAKENFCVHAARPIDMFPQTFHLESITLLERN